jgi:hypothetical protein
MSAPPAAPFSRRNPRSRIGLLLLSTLLAACGSATAAVSGEIDPGGSCSAEIDGERLAGPDGGVRVVSRAVDPDDPESRHVLVIYCLLTGPESEPARIDFVKLRAPATGELEPGTYTIDTGGDEPRTIGVVITAPELLDGSRSWEPLSGTLEIVSGAPESLEATFRMEVRAGGRRELP